MTEIRGIVKEIVAGPSTLLFRGVWSGPEGATLRAYDYAPFETDPVRAGLRAAADPEEAGARPFELPVERFVGGKDRLYARFRVGATAPGEQEVYLPGVAHVTEMQGVAAADYPYPGAPTIKGLQVRMVEDAIQLGVGHAALNLNLGTIIRPSPGANTVTYVMDGQEFYFDGEYLARFDRRVKELSDHGIVVNLILLNSKRWDDVEVDPALAGVLLHPDYDPRGFISAFNVVTEAGLAHYKAFVEFVAERYTRPDAKYGRACGYIIGNEVCSGWVWCNAGEKTVAEYVRQHGIAMRTAFYAARKKYGRARVYLSLDHHWTIFYEDNPLRCYPGREVVDLLNEMAVQDGNYDWSMAHHPYPQNLFHANFWDDETAHDSFDTPRITFKNIEVLSRYLSQPHLQYKGRLRHIILSEQGFHSDENAESERLQAAAYAYAYWKIERTPGIESFILHAHVDNKDEFGLNLGLWRRDKDSPGGNEPGTPKPIYYAFKEIDGPGREQVLEMARAVVGPDRWV